MEILAPAGGPEALQAAVFAGADAVYLGGPAFGARASARNFSREELREAVSFCRQRGVRVHVTVNTLLREGEMEQALEFVAFLCSLPVDAVLVQDMGLFSLLREKAPGLPLHCSTQMSLHTPLGAKLLHDAGASRVVLSRELSLEETGEIARACPVELESFVHGALCMSVSGQCYFSALLGGRSGNRGMCAQTCRLPFAAPDGTGHDLSLKDLSFIPGMGRLEKAGVCSAKIEGRMKRPEYVAAAVSACRRAADGEEIPPELLQNLEAVFSR
ncbi:MAG: U32 family peptidase, partial [Acutalibacter sp.]|nr:U32 family peptidase [Acutalibacter sp.]